MKENKYSRREFFKFGSVGLVGGLVGCKLSNTRVNDEMLPVLEAYISEWEKVTNNYIEVHKLLMEGNSQEAMGFLETLLNEEIHGAIEAKAKISASRDLVAIGKEKFLNMEENITAQQTKIRDYLKTNNISKY